MSLQFDHAEHRYTLDGLTVPSVTTILRDSGLLQFDHIPPHILEQARQRGAAVHALAHYYNEGDLDWQSVDPVYKPYLDGWIEYCDTRRLKPLLCEYRIASRKHQVAGTLDLLADIGGDGWLLDVKTGNPEDVAADLQTAAYLNVALEWAHTDPTLATVLGKYGRWRRAAVRLLKTGGFQCDEFRDPRDYSQFLTLAGAWHIRRDRGFIIPTVYVAA